MPKKKKSESRPEMYYVESREKWRKRVKIDGKWRDVYGDTKDDVRKQIREMERAVDAGMVLGDKTTLFEFSAQWFKVKSAGLRESTKVSYKNVMRNHIYPFFENIRLSEIRPLHVKQLLAERPEFSRAMQSKILSTLSQIMESALENGLISKNPCKGIKAGGETPKEKIPLTDEQREELLTVVKGTRAEIFVLLCLYAGLRREEALGLLWADVHLNAEMPYLDVRNTVTFTKNLPVHSPDLKSKAARRSIPLPPILFEAMKTARKTSKSLFVVPAVKDGGAMSKAAMRSMWAKAASVSFYVHPHLLRHTYITDLCAAGMDIKKIQYLAGHEDVSMTLRVYTHVKENTPRELGAVINEIFSGSNPGSRKNTKA